MTASLFGAMAGLGGMVHGVGGMLQGNVAPSGLVISSWTRGPIADYMGGEPGVTIVPNLLVTGALAFFLSLGVLVWAAIFVQRKNRGWILIGLSIAMLLVGAGVAPPIISVLAGAAGLGIRLPHPWWREHLPVKARRWLARLWPWVYGVCAINGVFLVMGSVILVYFSSLNNPNLFVTSFLFAVLLLLLTTLTSVAYDIQTSSSPQIQPRLRATT